jgi:hypothetical protein
MTLCKRRHADTPTRRHADTPTRRHADTPIRRYADTLMSGGRFPGWPEVLDDQCQNESAKGRYQQANEAIKI